MGWYYKSLVMKRLETIEANQQTIINLLHAAAERETQTNMTLKELQAQVAKNTDRLTDIVTKIALEQNDIQDRLLALENPKITTLPDKPRGQYWDKIYLTETEKEDFKNAYLNKNS